MEGTDLDLAISKLIGNNKLCLFSALCYWNLGNGVGQRPMFFSNRFSVETTEYEIFKCVNGFDDFVKDEKTGLYYTNPQRTICDLIVYDIDDLTILEALDDYLVDYSRDELIEYSKKYNVYEKLSSFLKEIDDGSYYLNYC